MSPLSAEVTNDDAHLRLWAILLTGGDSGIDTAERDVMLWPCGTLGEWRFFMGPRRASGFAPSLFQQLRQARSLSAYWERVYVGLTFIIGVVKNL